ncbi:MAG: response regulator [Methanobacteriota archaeon]|nr:MAG: response regulator [Euryarchaeota archaeon]
MIRILIVDDNPTNLKLACVLLRGIGYAVEPASDAEEAMAAIRRTIPDMILMDIELPGMDGLALTRVLKSNPSTKAIRIVAMTAFAMKGDETKAIDAGCDGYIAKPIDTRRFPEQVASYLAGVKEVREVEEP